MAPFGTIYPQVRLDRHQYRGPVDKIRGTVGLKFSLNNKQSRTVLNQANGLSTVTEQELFGPLRLKIILQGHVKLKVQENRTSHAYILFSEVRQLCRVETVIFDGPLRARAGSSRTFPFTASFPINTNDTKLGFWSLLPPTFYTRFEAIAPRQAGKHQGAAWIDYSLQVEAEMPGIDVQVVQPAETVLIYEQALPPVLSPPRSRTLEQILTVQSYELLPNVNGLVDRARAALRNLSKPIFVFEAGCSDVPEAAHLGEKVRLAVHARPIEGECTPSAAAEITLGPCEVEILARTQLYATSEKGLDSVKLDSTALVATLPVTSTEPAGAFARSQCCTKTQLFTKTLTLTAVPADLPTSFRIIKLERSYRIRVVLRFIVAGQVAVMKKDLPFKILPLRQEDGGVAEASSSAATAREEEPFLPSFEEVVPLPSYQDAIKAPKVPAT